MRRAANSLLRILSIVIALSLFSGSAARAADADGEAVPAAIDRGCATLDFGPPDLPRTPGKEHRPTLDASAITTVPVAFHVISKQVLKSGVWTKVGDVSSSKLDAQISVLNTAFATAGLRFVRASVDRTTNNEWFAMSMGSAAEAAAKRALAKDPTRYLNVYVCGPGNGILGWAYYPWSFPESNTMHGLTLLYTTLPGGSLSRYNKGDTAVHEIGHHFGLYHTFQNGCSLSGDFVADTPAEATPSYSCTLGRDTCPAAGLDPIDNYMDYGDDACMTRFSSGQTARMQWGLTTYKPRLAAQTTVLAADGAARLPIRIVTVNPNPFNPSAAIHFELDRDLDVSLRVFDVRGREVARLVDGMQAAGSHRVTFAGRDLASGVYHAVLQAGAARVQQRLVLLK
jgi:hypothetical protein